MLQLHCPEIEICGEANNAAQAGNLIENEHPDVVFLDIQMPRGNGFELLKSRQHRTFSVVFVTAFPNYSIQAIRADAVDYLLKPIGAIELKSAVQRVRERQVGRSAKKTPAKPEKIAVPHSLGISIVALSELEYLEADNMYTTLHLCGRRSLLVSKPISEFEGMLGDERFFRIHKSYLINLDQLLLFHKSGGAEAELKTGVRLPVSRRRLAAFQRALSVYARAL